MDRRERAPDLDTALLAAFQGMQTGIWTALPAVINTVDLAKQTVTVVPAIKISVVDKVGNRTWVSIPVIPDVPLFFPSGGGFTLTFPVKPGDECLIVFASRCIDSWWQNGAYSGGKADPQIQPDFRLHDLSDGFALVGFRSQPNVLSPSASTTSVVLRNATDSTHVSIDSSGTVDIKASGNLTAEVAGGLLATVEGSATIEASSITLTGNVTVNGSITATGSISSASSVSAPAVTGSTSVTVGTKALGSHTHTGVQTGSGNTGGIT